MCRTVSHILSINLHLNIYIMEKSYTILVTIMLSTATDTGLSSLPVNCCITSINLTGSLHV